MGFTKMVLTLAVAATFSFSPNPEAGIAGKYGVCACQEAPIVQLTLNEDHSFSYLDRSNPSKKVDVTGTWTLEKGRVVLGGYTSTYSFHTIWKVEDGGMTVKSRKGLAWYRLGNLEKCQ